MKHLVMIFMIAVSAVSCKATKNNMKGEVITLDETVWILESIGDRTYTKLEDMRMAEIDLKFTEGRVSTTDGCNGLGGEYTQEGAKLNFMPMMSTKMFCGDEIMKNLYKVPFMEVKKFSVEKDKLYLLSSDNKTLAIYRKK